MRLFAAVVPPREVLEQIQVEVRSVGRPAPTVAHPARGGRLRLFRGRGASTATVEHEPPGPTEELDETDIEMMHVAIASFGNVTLSDGVRLAAALRTEASRWPRPVLQFTGSAALEFSGDQSVWATLGGDVEGLRTIARGVPSAVERLGFFVDRRQFRPWLSVGTITDRTTAPYLERLVAALGALHTDEWTAEAVSVMRRLPAGKGRDDAYEEFERLPLG